MFTMKKSLPLVLAFALVAGVGAEGSPEARAQGSESRPVLVELFTSQGCSSCPPADEFAVRLSDEEDVMVLSLPVDYWDYIGWKDTLAQSAFTERQYAYAAVQRKNRVYTPQMMIDGQVDAVGSSEGNVRRLVQRRLSALNGGAGADLRLQRGEDGEFRAQASSGLVGADSATLWLVRLEARITVDIGRGENRGRSITYANVVRDMVSLGRWHGGSWSISVPLDGAEEHEGVALILQADSDSSGKGRGIGEVLATAWVKRPALPQS